MLRYLVIESKEKQKLDDDIIHLFRDLIPDATYVQNHHQAVLYFNYQVDISFHDVAINVMSDTLTDIRLYESYVFQHEKERDEHLEFIKKRLQIIPFAKYFYMDDRILIKHHLLDLDEELKRSILRKFYQDQVMIETLETYLSSNLNMVIASKKLYVHRNTLIQRIEKFHHMTGLDPRIFSDALLIYHLIQ